MSVPGTVPRLCTPPKVPDLHQGRRSILPAGRALAQSEESPGLCRCLFVVTHAYRLTEPANPDLDQDQYLLSQGIGLRIKFRNTTDNWICQRRSNRRYKMSFGSWN